MAYRYLGNRDGRGVLVFEGKAYQPGQSVPMTKAAVEHHVAHGLRFEGVDQVETPPPASTAADEPHDDRGAIIAEERPSRREPAPAPTA